MIVVWSDHDGDPVAIEAAEIVGLSVGDVTRPRSKALRVTLVWCRGLGQPFMVAAPFDDVCAAWRSAREQEGTEGAGWKFAEVVSRSRG